MWKRHRASVEVREPIRTQEELILALEMVSFLFHSPFINNYIIFIF